MSLICGEMFTLNAIVNVMCENANLLTRLGVKIVHAC